MAPPYAPYNTKGGSAAKNAPWDAPYNTKNRGPRFLTKTGAFPFFKCWVPLQGILTAGH